jgi:hypothetical protein
MPNGDRDPAHQIVAERVAADPQVAPTPCSDSNVSSGASPRLGATPSATKTSRCGLQRPRNVASNEARRKAVLSLSTLTALPAATKPPWPAMSRKTARCRLRFFTITVASGLATANDPAWPSAHPQAKYSDRRRQSAQQQWRYHGLIRGLGRAVAYALGHARCRTRQGAVQGPPPRPTLPLSEKKAAPGGTAVELLGVSSSDSFSE